jgi:hypothetical protein
MKVYGTYRFKDKDPVIDIARTCVEIYAKLHGLEWGPALREISKSSGVSKDCMYRWFRGHTRYPRFCTIVAVVHATGREVSVGKQSSKPRFRVVKGGIAA